MAILKDVQYLTLDFSGVTSNQSISVKQGDVKSRFIEITPVLNNQSLTLSEDEKVEFRCIKPDKKSVSYSVEYADGKINVELKEQVLAAAGVATADIVILGVDGEILSSAKFCIQIFSAASNGDYLPSKDYYKRQSNINMNGYTLKNLPKPTENGDAVNKEYVDNSIPKIDSKLSSISENPIQNKAVTQSVANALKGHLSGSIVSANDVSPIQHSMDVRVHGKNLFDVSKITDKTGAITNNGDGTLSIASNVLYCDTNQTLKEVCPQLKSGDVATISFITKSLWTKYIYLSAANVSWKINDNLTVTEDMLNSKVVFYGYNKNEASYGTENVISNIQIELGETATDYIPYIDPSTVKLTRRGSNIAYIPNISYTGSSVATNDFLQWYIDLPIGTEITVSADYNTAEATSATIGWNIVLNDGTKISLWSGTFTNSTTKRSSCTHIKMVDFSLDDVKYAILYLGQGNSSEKTVENITVNIGAADLGYEKYIDGGTYTPNEDGTVDIVSLSPIMTLLADTEGITIECEYNKDSNILVKGIRPYLTPDDFEGTDSEKLSQCFDALATSGGVIHIERRMTLDENITITHSSDTNNRITVKGVGQDAAIVTNGYSFIGSKRSCGGIVFENINFSGTANLIDGATLIRIYFNSCTFDGFTYIVASLDTYIQSVYITNCLVRNVSEYMLYTTGDSESMLYDAKVIGNIIEWGGGVANCISAQGCIFSHNCIEGMTKDLFYFPKIINQVTIDGNYFESNEGKVIDIGDGLEYTAQSITISNNNFFCLQDTDAVLIILPTVVREGKIVISGNNVRVWSTATFVLSNATVPLTNVVYMGNYGNLVDPNGTVTVIDTALSNVETALDSIIAMQESLIGGAE